MTQQDINRMCAMADALTEGRVSMGEYGGILTTKEGARVAVTKAEIDEAIVFAIRVGALEVVQ